jgi:hypothetical protein
VLCLVLAAIASHPVDFRLLSIQLALVTSDFRILPVAAILLALQLIAYECSSSQTKPPADRRSGSRVTHSRPDETARCGAAQSTNPSTFLPGAQRAPGASPNQQSSRQHDSRSRASKSVFHVISSW